MIVSTLKLFSFQVTFIESYRGKCEFDGTRYVPHGTGTFHYSDGRFCESDVGALTADNPIGHGSCRHPNDVPGIGYKGSFDISTGYCHGQGTLNSIGSVYGTQELVGTFDKDARTFRGVINYLTCGAYRHYRGRADFINGNYAWQGHGTVIFNHLQNGKWSSTSGQGAVYVGSIHQGFFHGEAKYTFQDGSVFTGVWAHGKMEKGKIDFQTPNGRYFKGIYQENTCIGKLVFENNHGWMSFEGTIDLPNGNGLLVDPPHELTSSIVQINGRGTVICKNVVEGNGDWVKSVYIGRLLHGKRHDDSGKAVWHNFFRGRGEHTGARGAER